jgi:capsular polysaccharide biosynthesis protein
MELRQYWNVIWKRRWLVLAIVGLTTILSAYMALRAGLTYEADVRFITRQAPTPDNNGYVVFTFDRYYNWFSSEFLVDDYTLIVQSDAFANAVLGIMGNRLSLGKGSHITNADIKGALEADRKNRELHVKVTASSKEEAVDLANTVALVLTDAKMKPIRGPMVDDKPVFTQIDEATADEVKSSRTKEVINAAIRVAISIAAALALVFLLEYLDTSVRDARDAESLLDMPVLGAIPRVQRRQARG